MLEQIVDRDNPAYLQPPLALHGVKDFGTAEE